MSCSKNNFKTEEEGKLIKGFNDIEDINKKEMPV